MKKQIASAILAISCFSSQIALSLENTNISDLNGLWLSTIERDDRKLVMEIVRQTQDSDREYSLEGTYGYATGRKDKISAKVTLGDDISSVAFLTLSGNAYSMTLIEPSLLRGTFKNAKGIVRSAEMRKATSAEIEAAKTAEIEAKMAEISERSVIHRPSPDVPDEFSVFSGKWTGRLEGGKAAIGLGHNMWMFVNTVRPNGEISLYLSDTEEPKWKGSSVIKNGGFTLNVDGGELRVSKTAGGFYVNYRHLNEDYTAQLQKIE